jgi:hypothetical protein
MTTKEKIEVMVHFDNGGDVMCKGIAEPERAYKKATTPVWNWSNYDYKIVPALTREEITAQWVKDNDVKVGDKLIILGHSNSSGSKGDLVTVNSCDNVYINVTVDKTDIRTQHQVENLQKVTSKIVKFTFDDREELRGKWVREKYAHSQEWQISVISKNGVSESIGVQAPSYTYEQALEELEFIDGKPFGKEIWE